MTEGGLALTTEGAEATIRVRERGSAVTVGNTVGIGGATESRQAFSVVGAETTIKEVGCGLLESVTI